MNLRRIPLLWKIWLSTSVGLTALFVVLGFLVLRSVHGAAAQGLLEEAQATARSYQALWEARAQQLQSLAAVAGGLPVSQKLLETPGLWSRVHQEVHGQSFLFIVDPEGAIVQRFPAEKAPALELGPLVRAAQGKFPKQSAAFLTESSVLYQVVITPLYSGSSQRWELTGVLIAGFAIDHRTAQELKTLTGKSECIFAARGRIFGSTLDDKQTGNVVRQIARSAPGQIVSDGATEYVPLQEQLAGFDGAPVARLWILRSFEDAQERLGALRRRIILLWEGAVVMGLLLTYLAVERIVKPIQDLDRAASEMAMQNYSYRVTVDSDDELGRLGATFNKMAESMEAARAELIRKERVGAIGRLASSIVHDLRNPLAAIYGGSELLAETQPSPEHTRRIAENVLRASRRIQEMLEDLTRVGRGQATETDAQALPLHQLVGGAVDRLADVARAQNVQVITKVPQAIHIQANRARLEGVFVNMIQNALDVMPTGGDVRIDAFPEGNSIMVEVADTGPGIPEEIRDQLFEPFVSHGKRNGLGLGLALARQTVRDHGGDLWVSRDSARGARFLLRLPRQASAG